MKRKYIGIIFVIAILLFSTIAAAGFWQDITGMFSFSLSKLFKKTTSELPKVQESPTLQTGKSMTKPLTIALRDIPFFDTPPPKTGPAKPDLIVRNIIFTEKELISNVELDAKVVITNAGRTSVTTKVPYSLGDSPREVKFLSKSPIIMSPGQTIEFPFTWQFQIEQPSLNSKEKGIYVVLDPLNEILEENENNNGIYKIFDVYSIIQGPKEQTKYYPALKDKNEYFVSSKKDFCIELNKNSICNKKAGNEFKTSIDRIEAKTDSNKILSIFKMVTTNAIALFKKSSSSSKRTKDANLEIKDKGIKVVFSSVVRDYVVPMHTGINCDYATADELMASCPSAEDRRQIRNDFNIAFDHEPATGSCTEGSDESSIMLTVYNTFRLMKCIPFETGFQWDLGYNNLYEWFKNHKPAYIRYFTCEGVEGSCYDHAGGQHIYLSYDNFNEAEQRRTIDPSSGAGAIFKVVLMMHEARHTVPGGGVMHTCARENEDGTLIIGANDRNLGEMGAWAVQYYLIKQLSENTGNYFTEYQKGIFGGDAEYLYNHMFCDYAISPTNSLLGSLLG